MNTKKQNREFSLLFLLISLAAVSLAFSGAPQGFLLLFIGVILFSISFVNTNFALVILIFSMLLSPEFSLGGISGRAVVLRLDDLFLFVIFFGWMVKMAVNKELGLLRINPLNKAILVYIFFCLVSTGVGILRGTTDIKNSIFYNLKYIEYFMVFFMVSNNIRNRRQAKIFLSFMLFTCLIVSIFAISVYLRQGVRATAPFEGHGEPNTLAGYLLIMMGLSLGLFLYDRSSKSRLLLGGFFIFLTLPLMFTLSRAGWLGFAAMYASFIVFTRRHRVMLLVFLLVMFMALPIILPKRVARRYDATFADGTTYNVLGREVTLDESASIRINTWKKSLKLWYEYPILGRGVPGGGVVSDVQYTRVLREVGLIGFFAFIWVIVRLFKAGFRNFSHPQVDDFGRGVSLGFICALVGLLAMGVATEVFIIIRIMEPFWFLAGVVVMLPELNISPELEQT